MICALVDFEMANRLKYQPSNVPIGNSPPIQTRQLIKVDEYGEPSTFDVYSEADYDDTTNMFNIDGTKNVSFNDESLISGGAFTIMFFYQGTSLNGGVNSNEEFVSFRSDPNDLSPKDIIIRRLYFHGILQVIVEGKNQAYSGILNMGVEVKKHFTIVIIPNGGVKVYMNGIIQVPVSYITLGDIPATKYNYQNLGGTSSKVKGLLGNFRFYNKELTSAEISAIGSVGTTTNDLLAFNLTTRLFQTQPRQLIKVDKYGEHSTFNAYSEAPYDETTNMWNINRTHNVEFNDEPLISGGAFTIMFSYQIPSGDKIFNEEEFVCFRTYTSAFHSDDIRIIRRLTGFNVSIIVKERLWIFGNLLNEEPYTYIHITAVIVPNVGIKVYKNGIEILNPSVYYGAQKVDSSDYGLIGDIPAKTYDYQNLGGSGSKLGGSIGNFRFYDRELSASEIFALGSTSNDLVAFRKIDEVYTTANVGYYTEADEYPTFRCKMPYLPSDVPHMMGFELLQASVTLDKAYFPHTGTFLYLLDNADNCHNNTLKNEICLSRLESVHWRWYPQVEGENALNGINTNQYGIVSFQTMSNEKPIKMYIPTKQNYLYFQLQDKGTRTDGRSHIVNKAKLMVRLTFDKKQNEYQPKRIML